MKSSVFSVLLFLIFSASGQHVVTFEKATIEPVLDFDVKEWVDLRPNKENIGWAQKGMANRRVDAIVNQPLPEILTKYFKSDSKEVKLAVRIRQLFVNELTKATKEFGFANISLEVFRIELEGYRYLSTISYTAQSRAADVTKKHGQNILNAAYESLKFVDPSSGTKKILMQDQWDQNAAIAFEISNLPILREEPQDGVFLTLSDFHQNETQDIDLIIKEAQKVSVKVEEAGKNVDLNYGFAIANNGKIFIRFEGGFFPLKRNQDTFEFVGPNRVDSNSVSTGALIGGLVGAGIAAAASKEKWKYKVDLATGTYIQTEKIK